MEKIENWEAGHQSQERTISHVHIEELSVFVVHRDARHGMGYGRLESHRGACGQEILSAIVKVGSIVRLIEDHYHGVVLGNDSVY